MLWSRDLDSAYLCRHVSLKVFSRRPRIDSEMEYDNHGCVSEPFRELQKFSARSSVARHSGLVWNCTPIWDWFVFGPKVSRSSLSIYVGLVIIVLFFCLCNWERVFGGNLTLFGKVVHVWVRDRIQLKFSLWLNIAGVLFTLCWEWCKTICAFCSFCKLTLPYNCFIPFRDNFLKRISFFLCSPIVAWGKVLV